MYKLLDIFEFGGTERGSVRPEGAPLNNCRYPIEELGGHVGQVVDVCYVNVGISKRAKAKLMFRPNQDFFYVGSKSGEGHFIIYWDQRDPQGRRDAVRSIALADGKIIYENIDVAYDSEAAKDEEATAKLGRPPNDRPKEIRPTRAPVGVPSLDGLVTTN